MEDLIYVEDTDKLEAGVAANYFVEKDIRNRVYINTLSAELAMKYLVALGLDAKDLKNIHSVKKVIETFDIADVMMKNIHIDVRAVFDEDVIFIPKSHFEFNLVPDIYLVFQYMRNFSDVKILGFFEPKLINKNNSNKEYYFIEKEKLCPICDLKSYIENFDGNTDTGLSQEERETCETLIVSVCDHDVSDDDKKYLFGCLMKSLDLRDKFNEFENFETLSFKAMADTSVQKKYFNMEVKSDESDMFSNIALAGDVLSGIGTGVSAQALTDVVSGGEFLADTVLDNEPIVEEYDEHSNVEAEIADDEVENNINMPQVEPLEEVQESDNDFSTSEFENNFENIEFTDFEDEQIETMRGEDDSDTQFVDTEPLNSDDFIENQPQEEISLTEQVGGMNAEDVSSFGLNLLENLAQEDIDKVDETQNGFELQDFELPENPEESIAKTEQPTEMFDFIETENSFEQTETQNDNTGISLESLSEIDTLPELQTEPSAESLPEFSEIETLPELEPKSEAESLPEFNEMSDIQPESVSNDFTEFDAFPELQTEPLAESLPEFSEIDTLPELQTEPLAESLSEFSEIDTLPELEPQPVAETSSEPPSQTQETVDEFNELNSIYNQDFDLKSEIQKKLDGMPSDDVLFEDVITELPPSMPAQDNNLIQPQEFVPEINDIVVDTPENDTDELQVLYDNEFTEELPEKNEEISPKTRPIPGISLFENTEKLFANKKLMITSALSLAIVVVAVCGINMVKSKNTSEIAEQKPAENVLDSNVPTEVPSDAMPEQKIEVPAQMPSENKVEVKSAVKSSNSSMDVSKIIWDVPDSLSYSTGMQNFLRTAGKSIKLSLSADLLLADEYAYTNQVKVALKLSKDGNILDSKVVSGSGSSQIDNIVLQSVKDTLSVLKPPSSEINTPDFNLNLIIYF